MSQHPAAMTLLVVFSDGEAMTVKKETRSERTRGQQQWCDMESKLNSSIKQQRDALTLTRDEPGLVFFAATGTCAPQADAAEFVKLRRELLEARRLKTQDMENLIRLSNFEICCLKLLKVLVWPFVRLTV